MMRWVDNAENKRLLSEGWQGLGVWYSAGKASHAMVKPDAPECAARLEELRAAVREFKDRQGGSGAFAAMWALFSIIDDGPLQCKCVAVPAPTLLEAAQELEGTWGLVRVAGVSPQEVVARINLRGAIAREEAADGKG